MTWLRRETRAAWALLLLPYGLTVLVVASITALLLTDPPIDRVTVALCYLLSVVVLSAWAGYGPGILTAFLSFFTLNYFFIPPRFSFHVAEPQSLFQLCAFMVIGIIAGSLAARARSQAEHARAQATEMAALYRVSQQISMPIDLDHILSAIAKTTCELLHAPCCAVLLYDERGLLVERAVVGSPLPTHRARHTFIRDGARVLGDLCVTECMPGRGFTSGEQALLAAIATHAYLAVDRARLVEQTTRAQAAMASDRLKSALLSSVSHDLRTPLATIKGASSTLLAHDVVLDQEAQHELAQSIDREADWLNRLVGNWLDIARIEAGGLPLERDWQDVADMVGAAMIRWQSDSHALAVELPDDLPLVWANAPLVDQVLTNLLENARKYAPAGTTVTITARKVDNPPDLVALNVRDCGTGVPSHDLEHIFEPLYRGRRSGSERAGSGLGLAICRGIIEAHGGRIWAEPALGGGTSITFTLPTRS